MVSSVTSLGGISSAYSPQGPGGIRKGGTDLSEKIDTNGDGSITAEEFISSRPETVTEDQATQLWSMLDASNNGSLTRSQFVSAIETKGPPPGPPPVNGDSGALSEANPSSQLDETTSASDELMKALMTAIEQYSSATGREGTTGGSHQAMSLSDLFGKIDTDGDGLVTEEEFVTGRPEDMSEANAKEMWLKLDTENSGSLTESQFSSAMENLRPPAEVNSNDLESSSETQLAAASHPQTTAADELVKALMAAIQQYSATMGQNGLSSSTVSSTSGLLSTVG